jgi:hypothetical protein
MCSTCPAHLILLYLITLTMFGKENKLWKFLTVPFSTASRHLIPLRNKPQLFPISSRWRESIKVPDPYEQNTFEKWRE